MTYKEKLLDPRWQRKRLEILSRDEFECQYCGNQEKTLSVHHKKYLSGLNPWEYDDDYLMTLCEDCHSLFHNGPLSIGDASKALSDAFIIKGFSPNDIEIIAKAVASMEMGWRHHVVADIFVEFVKDIDQQELIINQKLMIE